MKMNNVMKKISFLTVLGLMMGQSINASVALPPGAVSSINIINLPAGYLFAAQVESGNSVQAPIDGKSIYALYPNTTYYTITRVNRNDTIKSKQHPQSDFAGHDTWDAISDVISNAATSKTETIYTTFYNETGGDIIVTPQIVTDSTIIPLKSITIPHVPGDINASLKIISVETLPGAKVFYTVTRSNFTPVMVKYDPTTYPAGYRINGDPKAKQVLATGLTVPEPGANFIKVINIKVINMPKYYFLTTDFNSADSQEIPIENNTNTYAIYPNTMYYIKKMNTYKDNDIKSKHPASDFTGKTTWDVTTNKIS